MIFWVSGRSPGVYLLENYVYLCDSKIMTIFKKGTNLGDRWTWEMYMSQKCVKTNPHRLHIGKNKKVKPRYRIHELSKEKTLNTHLPWVKVPTTNCLKRERQRERVCVWCCPSHWKCWGVQQGYFWISDNVSMAADASQRKALRYQQTLVGLSQIYLYLPVCLLSCQSLKMFSFPLISCPSTCFTLISPSTHLSLSPLPFNTFLYQLPPAASFLIHPSSARSVSSFVLFFFFLIKDFCKFISAAFKTHSVSAAFTPPMPQNTEWRW